MIDSSSASLDIISVHHVGNKNNGEDILISKHPLDSVSPDTDTLLKKYFLNAFQTPEYFNFTFSNGDYSLNPLYKYASEIFDGHSNFHINSINIAKHLYESSNHPMIKAGDLFIAYISNMKVDYQDVEAIGIFKCENKQKFLKLDRDKQNFILNNTEGIQADKPDKACLIFNSGKENGFKVCIIDKTNKAEEARFWKEQFLMLRSGNDEFHQTRDFLNIAKKYVTEQLNEDFEVNKSDQIDLLNRSMDYFKSRDEFKKEEFEEEVFGDPGIIESFRRFDKTYRNENDIALSDEFEISLPAVKKQAKVFKSILKLDRNFHIYIHGNKDLIEHGVERDGRKYYKIYYDKET